MIRRLVTLCLLPLLLANPLRAEIAIQEVTSPGGIKAWLVEEHAIPFTALEIRFGGGSALDDPGKRGAVHLMTALLEEGAAEMNAQKFAESRDALAADFRFDSGMDTVSVSARMLTENRSKAVELLRLALVHPRFDQDAVDRVRGQVLAGIRAGRKDPGTLASETFNRLAFGAHPYGQAAEGTEDSVAGLTRDDMLAAHKAALSRQRLYISAVGDITGEELGALLDHLLGELPATGAPLPGVATVGLTGGVTLEPFPTPQAVVIFGHEGIPRDDPDYVPAYVLNEIVGGSRFGSRLMTELREKRGLTYGVGSYLVDYEQADLVMGQMATANATAKQAVDLLQSEWSRAAEGVTQAELDAVKTYLTGAYALRFDSNRAIAGVLVGMQMAGYDTGYPARRNAMIEAVTLDDIARVAKRLYRPDALRFVVVGEPEGLVSTP